MPAARSASDQSLTQIRRRVRCTVGRSHRLQSERASPDRPEAALASTAGSAHASSRVPTRPVAARWRARSSSRACCSTTTACATTSVRPLASLNDSKQVSPAEREELFRAVVGCAARISVRVIPSSDIDRNGLHKSNLVGAALRPRRSRATRRGLPRRRLSARADRAAAPRRRRRRHEERRDRGRLDRRQGDRDRVMRRLDALYPRYGFARHVGYITPGPLRGGARARAVRPAPALVQRACVRIATLTRRRAARHYRLRGYRILGANVWAGGYELDLIVRRGRRLVFCEVKAKTGDGFGDPLEMVDAEKLRRLRRAAEAWLARNPELPRARLPLRGRRSARPVSSSASRFNPPATRYGHSAGYDSACRKALSPNGRTRQNGFGPGTQA